MGQLQVRAQYVLDVNSTLRDVTAGGISTGGGVGVFSKNMDGALILTDPNAVRDAYTGSMALGGAAIARYTNSIAIGLQAESGIGSSGESIAMGYLAQSGGSGSGMLAIGRSAKATNFHGIAMGAYSSSQANEAVALGGNAEALAAQAVAIGTRSQVSGENSVVIGSYARSVADDAIAIGDNAIANTSRSIAIGRNAQILTSGGASAIAIGDSTSVTDTDGVAVGRNAQALKARALALGPLSVADGVDVAAIGAYATSRFTGSTAIGTRAVTTRANQVMIGDSNTEVTVANIAGSGNQLVFSSADGTLNRYTGTTTLDTDLRISGSQVVGTDLTVGGNVTLSSYASQQNAGTLEVLSTDATGQLKLAVLPSGTTTFCNRTGANSACYGSLAEALGEFDTAIGANSRADAEEGATAVGANANASGNGALALGVDTQASGTGSIAIGYDAVSTATSGIALGDNAVAAGSNAFAYGTNAVADGVNVMAIGAGARAEGYNTNALAIGSAALANGTDVTALGAGATATGVRATAIGAGAVTTRNNQVVIGTTEDDVTVPGLAGKGSALVQASSDGTLQRSTSVSLQSIDRALSRTIPNMQATTERLESAASNLGVAVESTGAIAAAMSAVPEVSLQADVPVRCGIGTGGYGSQYAVSAGCAVRVASRLHLNGALAYTPSIDYQYGSTPSVAGRLGFSFLLGRINRPKASSTAEQASQGTADLKETIARLQQQIQTMQEEKAAAEQAALQAGERRDRKILELETMLAQQQALFQSVVSQLQALLPSSIAPRIAGLPEGQP